MLLRDGTENAEACGRFRATSIPPPRPPRFKVGIKSVMALQPVGSLAYTDGMGNFIAINRRLPYAQRNSPRPLPAAKCRQRYGGFDKNLNSRPSFTKLRPIKLPIDR